MPSSAFGEPILATFEKNRCFWGVDFKLNFEEFIIKIVPLRHQIINLKK